MEVPPYLFSMLGHILLFMLSLGMSATVDINSLVTQVRNTKAIYTGVFMQFIVLPFLGFLSVKMFDMENVTGLMLLIVTSSPGGSFSNWWCSLFNADLALSITMTSISTILSMIMLPLNLYMYTSLAFGGGFDVMKMINFKDLATSLIVVISACTIGVIASTKKKSHKFNVHANWLGTFAGLCLAILAATVSFVNKEEVNVFDQEWTFFAAILFPPTAGLLLSNAVTTYRGLLKPERVTASIETSAQNVAIAITFALTLFDGAQRAKAMSVPFFYGVTTFVVIGIYCVVCWKAGWTKAPPSEPLWKVVTYSYEVAAAEQLEKYGVDVPLQEGDVSCGAVTCLKLKEDDEKSETMLTKPAHKKESKQHVELALDWLKNLGYQMKESLARAETTSSNDTTSVSQKLAAIVESSFSLESSTTEEMV